MSTRTRRRKAALQPRPDRLAAPAVNPLYRSGLWLFAVFALGMLAAFWPSYFSRLGSQPSYHAHAHGLAMTLWVALLVAQAALVRWGRRDLHRRLGVLSYLVMPAIVVSTVNFVHFRVRGAPDLGPFALHFMALVLNALLALLVLWGLAMYHRRQPATHARYMIATVFPLFTPVTDRLIGRFAPGLIGLVPQIDGSPVLPFAGFVLADILLAGLALWDWRANRRSDVFPRALAVLLLYHVSVMTLHRVALWKAIMLWFAGLPLS